MHLQRSQDPPGPAGAHHLREKTRLPAPKSRPFPNRDFLKLLRSHCPAARTSGPSQAPAAAAPAAGRGSVSARPSPSTAPGRPCSLWPGCHQHPPLTPDRQPSPPLPRTPLTPGVFPARGPNLGAPTRQRSCSVPVLPGAPRTPAEVWLCHHRVQADGVVCFHGPATMVTWRRRGWWTSQHCGVHSYRPEGNEHGLASCHTQSRQVKRPSCLSSPMDADHNPNGHTWKCRLGAISAGSFLR